jgi:hypothetical protein
MFIATFNVGRFVAHILRVRSEMAEALIYASTLASMVHFGGVTDFLPFPFVRVRE